MLAFPGKEIALTDVTLFADSPNQCVLFHSLCNRDIHNYELFLLFHTTFSWTTPNKNYNELDNKKCNWTPF